MSRADAPTGTAPPPPERVPLPQVGDVLHVSRVASVQFIKPIFFRVIRPLDWDTYYGWRWLDGYRNAG